MIRNVKYVNKERDLFHINDAEVNWGKLKFQN